ncbi:hypothetical protein Pelo_16489 [Pelomyxa schiedti]|nr:hypothetical protein Pelo_16489 [Pelomyxa schiedti]
MRTDTTHSAVATGCATASPAPTETTTTTATTHNRRRSAAAVLEVSRLVWDTVVSGGWIDNNCSNCCGAGMCCCVALFRVAEAMFPLVALVSKRALKNIAAANSITTRGDVEPEGINAPLRVCFSSYDALVDAARAPATSCIQWMLSYIHDNGSSIRSRGAAISSRKSAASYAEAWETGRAVKEVVAVLHGLCTGGHVDLARRCVKGWTRACNTNSNSSQSTGSDGGGDHCAEEMSGALRKRVLEYVRAGCGKYNLIQGVCALGNLEALKWLIGVLGIGNDDWWMLYGPMCSAAANGKMQVLEWIHGECHFETLDLVVECASGTVPGCTKWVLDSFHVELDHNIIYHLLRNKDCKVEDCQWAVDALEEETRRNWIPPYGEIKNAEVFKLATRVFPFDHRDERSINNLLKYHGDVALAEWLVTEESFAPSPDTFAAACSTSPKNGSSLAKWLSTRVTLSQSDALRSLKEALLWNNTEVADWLEESFHVIDGIQSNPEVARITLAETCIGAYGAGDGVAGLKWLIEHLSHPVMDSSSHDMFVVDTILGALGSGHLQAVVVLLDYFTGFEPQRHPVLVEKLVMEFIYSGDAMTLQHILNRCCAGTPSTSTTATRELIVKCLTSGPFPLPHSSKIVKWLISEYHLEYEHIRRCSHLILFKLLSRRKNRCAQWLIESFSIPPSDILDMAKKWCKPNNNIDLSSLQMLVNKFPSITKLIRQKTMMMMLVIQSPHSVLHAISHCGITLDEVRDYYVAGSVAPFTDERYINITLESFEQAGGTTRIQIGGRPTFVIREGPLSISRLPPFISERLILLNTLIDYMQLLERRKSDLSSANGLLRGDANSVQGMTFNQLVSLHNQITHIGASVEQASNLRAGTAAGSTALSPVLPPTCCGEHATQRGYNSTAIDAGCIELLMVCERHSMELGNILSQRINATSISSSYSPEECLKNISLGATGQFHT